MSRINWREKLNWSDENIDELRLAGYAYLRQGKYEMAVSFFEALSIVDPESSYDVQTLGALYVQINQPLKALKCFDKALKLEADHAPTLLNLTKALLMIGKKDEAIRLARILSREPNSKIANTAQALILAWA
ncbi:MAG: tetratricopeptide repeat protein [Parachlamydiales bacterium]|jgi:tetratricopeptide (TPR) repeat protein